MEELWPVIISLLKSDPVKAVAVLLIVMCAVLFFDLRRRFSKDIIGFNVSINGFTKKMTYWEEQIRNHTAETGKNLLRHSEDMGKATKAINGDMLKIHESFLALKEQTLTEIEKLKTFGGALERQFLLLAQKNEMTLEAMDQKFGRVIEIKKNLEQLNGKVTLIEETFGSNHAKNLERFGSIGKTLETHKTALQQIQFEIHKGKKGKT